MPANLNSVGKEENKKKWLTQLTDLLKKYKDNDLLDTLVTDKFNRLEGRIRRYSDASDYQVITQDLSSLNKTIEEQIKKRMIAKPIALREIPAYLREEKTEPRKSCLSCLFAKKPVKPTPPPKAVKPISRGQSSLTPQ